MGMFSGTTDEQDLAQDEALAAETRNRPIPSLLISTEDEALMWLVASRPHVTSEESYDAQLTRLHSLWRVDDVTFWALVDRYEAAAAPTP